MQNLARVRFMLGPEAPTKTLPKCSQKGASEASPKYGRWAFRSSSSQGCWNQNVVFLSYFYNEKFGAQFRRRPQKIRRRPKYFRRKPQNFRRRHPKFSAQAQINSAQAPRFSAQAPQNFGAQAGSIRRRSQNNDYVFRHRLHFCSPSNFGAQFACTFRTSYSDSRWATVLNVSVLPSHLFRRKLRTNVKCFKQEQIDLFLERCPEQLNPMMNGRTLVVYKQDTYLHNLLASEMRRYF